MIYNDTRERNSIDRSSPYRRQILGAFAVPAAAALAGAAHAAGVNTEGMTMNMMTGISPAPSAPAGAVDPILAAIAAHRTAVAVNSRALRTCAQLPDDRLVSPFEQNDQETGAFDAEAFDAETDALVAILNMPATTIAGIAAALAYIDDVDRAGRGLDVDRGEDGTWRPSVRSVGVPWHMALARKVAEDTNRLAAAEDDELGFYARTALRLEGIIGVLSSCHVADGFEMDQAVADAALEACRRLAAGNLDEAESEAADSTVINFAARYG